MTPADILVVDDSIVVRKVARRILERRGFAVSEADDGEEAPAACRAAMPHVVLLDRNMPVLDGIGFLKAVRGEFSEAAPSVVMCATEAAMDRTVEGLEASVQEYAMKPFDRGFLVEKLALVGGVVA